MVDICHNALSKPIESITPRVDPRSMIDLGDNMCQCRDINYNKRTTLGSDVHSGGGISVPASQLCCELTTAPKIVFFKMQQTLYSLISFCSEPFQQGSVKNTKYASFYICISGNLKHSWIGSDSKINIQSCCLQKDGRSLLTFGIS